MTAFTADGYRVASDDELATYEATLCALCNGERRQSATFEATCAFVETVLAGFVCRPCAIADWAESMLEGRVPVDLMEPEDRTLTHQQLNLSTTACWILLGRMPAAVLAFKEPNPVTREGSRYCESGSIASGGTRTYCTCDRCF